MATDYDIEKSNLIVLEGDEDDSWQGMWAIFDVSKTVIRQFIACHWESKHPNETRWVNGAGILVMFDDVQDLLHWCAQRKLDNEAEFRGGLETKWQDGEWLDKECQIEGWESWEDYVQHVENNNKKRIRESFSSDDLPFGGWKPNEDEDTLPKKMKRCPSCGSLSDNEKPVYCDNCGTDYPVEITA